MCTNVLDKTKIQAQNLKKSTFFGSTETATAVTWKPKDGRPRPGLATTVPVEQAAATETQPEQKLAVARPRKTPLMRELVLL